jgi:hypothetical protein
LPPRELELTAARRAVGIVALAAGIGVIAFVPFWIYLEIVAPEKADVWGFISRVVENYPTQVRVRTSLAVVANILTVVDLFRHRRIPIGRAVLAVAVVWAFAGLSALLYWTGEFQRAKRDARQAQARPDDAEGGPRR